MEQIDAPLQRVKHNHFYEIWVYFGKNLVLMSQIIEQENELESYGDDDLLEVADPSTVTLEIKGCMKTPRASLYEHNVTHSRSIYWECYIQEIPISVWSLRNSD
nr:hypothetical protein [Tanacetum cinerariifolium]